MRALLALITILSFPAYSWNNIEKDFMVMDTDIRYLWTGGKWQQDDKMGFYRILLAGGGYEHYKTKLYIQWVEHGTDMDAAHILQTIGIQELNAPPLYAFSLPSCIDETCHRITVNTTHTYEFTQHTFIIQLTAIGQYIFQKVVS